MRPPNPPIKRGPGRPRKHPPADFAKALAYDLASSPERIAEIDRAKYLFGLDEPSLEHPALTIPADWNLGAMLNVRNHGEYVVTLFPEEYDYRKPERALRFSNSFEAQAFVSAWYSRTYEHP